MIKKSKPFVFPKHKHITLNINLVMHYIWRRQIPKWEPSYNLPFILANTLMYVGVENITTMNNIIYHKVFIKRLVIDD